MPRTALILVSYVDALDEKELLTLSSEADYVICADGGQMIASRLGIRPDCVIGDFDSTTELIEMDCLTITYPVEKDITDSEAALLHAEESDCTDVLVYGGIGGRLDHTLGNLALLERFKDSFRSLRFQDHRNEVRLLRNETVTLMKDPRYPYFGLAVLDQDSPLVTIHGAHYDLESFPLPRATTRGISNEIEEDSAVITIEGGSAFLVRSSDSE